MNKHAPILLVEDDIVDVMTIQRAVGDLDIRNGIVVVNDGQEALTYLKDKNNPKPVFILLDVYMPRMNGVEFLAHLRKNYELRRIPVVILTRSVKYLDKVLLFELSIAGYIAKPVEYEAFLDIIQTIHEYWSLSEHPELE